MADLAEKTISVTEFKAQCLALIDELAEGKASRVVLTKRGKAIVAITRISDQPYDPWGAHRGLIHFVPGVDLTEPLATVWKTAEPVIPAKAGIRC